MLIQFIKFQQFSHENEFSSFNHYFRVIIDTRTGNDKIVCIKFKTSLNES